LISPVTKAMSVMKSLDAGLAEIGLERGQEVGLVLLEHADHLLELVLAPGQRTGVAGVVDGAKGVGDVGHPHVLSRSG